MESAISVDLVGVVVATIVGQAVGFAWYGPLFGVAWAKASLNMNPQQMAEAKKKGMSGQTIALSILGTFLMAYVLAHSIAFASAAMPVEGVSAGLQGGVWNWLGFVAPVVLGKVLWEGKPWKVFLIDAGHFLAAMCAMGLVLAFWK